MSGFESLSNTAPLHEVLPWLANPQPSRDCRRHSSEERQGVIYTGETPAFWQRGIIIEQGITYAGKDGNRFEDGPVLVEEGARCTLTDLEPGALRFLMKGKCVGVDCLREVAGHSMVVNIPDSGDVQDFVDEANAYRLKHGNSDVL